MLARPVKYVSEDGCMIEAPEEIGNLQVEQTLFKSGSFRNVFIGKVTKQKNLEPWKTLLQLLQPMSKLLGDCWPKAVQKDGSMKCAVKVSKKGHAQQSDQWTPDLEVLISATRLATAFNKFREELHDEIEKGLCAPIEYTTAFVFKVTNAGDGSAFEVGEYVLVEPYLSGNYEKLNSNSGFVANGDGGALADAFSHWTWHHTRNEKEQLLLCDIQGVFEDGRWLLTDPAAHSSAEGTMGWTDLGPKGVNRFFQRHTCNSLCKGLTKPEISGVSDPSFKTTRRTRVIHEVAHMTSTIYSQEDNTCYAEAVATVMRFAQKEVHEESAEDHDSIVSRIVGKYGRNGASSQKVLEDECARCGFTCLELGDADAIEAIQNNRAVLATFALTKKQFSEFCSFFEEDPEATLSELSSSGCSPCDIGHAVVICGFGEGLWKIRNSWGKAWADGGHAHIAVGVIEFKFFVAFSEEVAYTGLPDEVLAGVTQGGRKNREIPSQYKDEYADFEPIEVKDGGETTAEAWVRELYQNTDVFPEGEDAGAGMMKRHPCGNEYVVFVPKEHVPKLYRAYKSPEVDEHRRQTSQGQSRQGRKWKPRLVFPPFEANP